MPENDDTQSLPAADTASFQAIEEEQVAPGPPPPPMGPPPRALFDDVWPWLALLGIVVVAGLLVWLFVFHNRHHAKHVVPAVVGLQQQAAIQKLTGDGYNVKAIREPANKPRGIVASQAPGGGSQLPKGSLVTLHVSIGRAPVATTTTTAATTTTATTTTTGTTTTAAPTAQVPDVSNTDLATAEGQIEAAGFVSQADPVAGSGTPGSVQSQTPSAGQQAPAGSIVGVSIAKGSSSQSVQVPQVVGKSGADARAALAQAKLTYKTVYKKGKPGVVLAESPTGSQPVYTQVVLTVGS